jgi:hypothetical protein
VLDWPVRERLAQQVARMRTAAWNARVALATRAGEAATTLLLPLYTWSGRRRKRRKKRKETTGEQSGVGNADGKA